MAVNKARTINEKVINEPANKNDQFKFCGIELKEIFQAIDKNEKPNKKNTKTVIPNSVERVILSTELTAGMTLKAIDYKKEKQEKSIGENR